MLVSFLRTIVLFSLVVLAIRIMGKRELAQLQPFEIVIAVMLAELACIPMADQSTPLIMGVIPILTILLVHYLLTTLMLHSERFRKIICGRPSIVIEKGRIRMDELKRQRCNLNDLLEELRTQGTELESVEYAIFEPGGAVSLILKSQNKPLTPKDMSINIPQSKLSLPIVLDGRYHRNNLERLNKNETEFKAALLRLGYDDLTTISYASLDDDSILIIQGSGKDDVVQRHDLKTV